MYFCEAIRRIRCASRHTVEVFKTNVYETEAAMVILEGLRMQYPWLNINFDLEDCDKILRVAGRSIEPNQIREYMQVRGFVCEELTD